MSPGFAPPPAPVVAPSPVVFGRTTVRIGPRTARIQAVIDGRERLAVPVPRGPRRVALSLPTGRWNLRVRSIGPGGVTLSGAQVVWVLPGSGARLGTTKGRLDRRLQADLVALTGRLPAISGVYVQHLLTGCGAGVNAGAQFPTASVLKAGILLDAVRRPAGASSSLLDQMIIDSSDRAANQVLAIQGGGDGVAGSARVTETLRAIGLQQALVRRPYIIEETAGRPIPVETTAQPALFTNFIGSPYELARMFVVIHRGALGGGALRTLGVPAVRVRAEVTRRLLEVRDRTKLAQALPPGVPLMHKTGYTEQVKNDVGVVYTRSGPIVVAVMTWSAGGVSDATGDGFIAEVGRAVLKRLSGGGRC